MKSRSITPSATSLFSQLEVQARFKGKFDNLDPQFRRASGFAFYNTSRYDFAKLLADAPHVAQNLRNYIVGFSPNMREVLELRLHRHAEISGSVQDGAETYTESGMNSAGRDHVIGEHQTAAEFDKPEYRFLVVANKFQTGFDQSLLHTMYVDKKLGGVNAVQTLSRLNRTHPGKTGVTTQRGLGATRGSPRPSAAAGRKTTRQTRSNRRIELE